MIDRDDLELELDVLRRRLPPPSALPGACINIWAPLHVRHFDDATEYRGVQRELTDRWTLDETRVAVSAANGGPLVVGDNVLWLGEVEEVGHDVVWAPASVVGVESLQTEAQFVQSLCDWSALPSFTSRPDWSQGEPEGPYCPPADLPPILRDELAGGPREAAPLVAFALHQVFDQLSRCPRCGGALVPVLFGMPAGPPVPRWPAGGLEPWDPGGDLAVLGCSAPGTTTGAVTCRRCGLSTPDAWRLEPAAVEALEWPWSLWAAISEEEIRRVARTRRERAGGEALHVVSAGRAWSAEGGPKLSLTVGRARSDITVELDARTGAAVTT